jgi:hypothetical protein
MRAGTINQISLRRKRFIAHVDAGDYVVFELLGFIPVSVGDRISGLLNTLGKRPLQHLCLRRSFEAYGQSGPTSLQACQSLIVGF